MQIVGFPMRQLKWYLVSSEVNALISIHKCIIHVMSLKVASGRFFFHFREVFEKCIDYIGKFLVHFREVLKFS